MKRSLFYLSLGAASLGVLALSTYTYRSVDGVYGSELSAIRLTAQLGATRTLMEVLNEVEICQRDYLLSARAASLEACRTAVGRIPAAMDNLALVVRDSHFVASGQFQQLQQAVKDRLADAVQFVASQQANNRASMVPAATDMMLQQEYRTAIDRLIGDLGRTLDQHNTTTLQRIQLNRRLTLGACTAFLALLALLLYWMVHGFAVNSRLISTLKRVRSSLERRVEQRTAKLESAYLEAQQREERLRLVLEGAGDAFWDWNLKNNTVFYSPRWLHMRGLTADEVTGTLDDWLNNIHPDDRVRVRNVLDDHFANGTRFDCDYRVQHKDGHSIWIHDRAAAHRDAEGRLVRMTGTQTDVSARKRLAEALHDSATFNRQIVAHINTGVVVLDSRRRHVLWNNGMEKLTGIPEGKLLGQPFNASASCLDQPSISRLIDQCLRGEVCEPLEIQLACTQGERWVFASGSALRNTNAVIVGVVLAVHDVTARKQSDLAIEQLNARLRQLNARLVADIEAERKRIAQALHDETGQGLVALRLHINRLLKRCPATSDCSAIGTEILQTIDETAEGLRRIFTGLRPLQLERTGIVTACRELLTTFESNTGIPVDFYVMGEFNRLDENRSITVYRTLQEALTNIARHADATAVQIALTEKQEHLELSERDNGRGFVPGNESYGLLGIRERAAHLNGQATIMPAEDGGTCVSVVLPAGDTANAGQA